MEQSGVKLLFFKPVRQYTVYRFLLYWVCLTGCVMLHCVEDCIIIQWSARAMKTN